MDFFASLLACGIVMGAFGPRQLHAAAGDLCESDLDTSSIMKFTAAGARSTLATGMNQVFGVAFNSKAELFAAADEPNNKIYKIPGDGTKTTFISSIVGPFALAFDGEDNLFVSNYKTGTIFKITPAGVTSTFRGGLPGPVGLAFDRSGNLFVACQDSDEVVEIAASGLQTTFAAGLARPTGLAFDAAGNLFVGQRDSGVITRLAPDATKTTFASGLTEPFGLAFDGAGNLFVVDHTPGIVFKYTPAGTRTTFASGLHLPTFLAFEPPTGVSVNISTRAQVLTNDNVLIGGFIVTGIGSKDVIVRAIGPSLTNAGVLGALQDPVLELHDSSGALMAENDNWRDTQETAISNTGLPPNDDRESAIIATLVPGAYTAIERGQADGTGVGLVEIYDLAADGNADLGNISTRALIDTGSNVLIGGFIVAAGNGGTVLVRAIGPSLSGAGLSNVLANPKVDLHDANGAVLASNDDWKSTQMVAIQASGIPPTDDLEAAILMTLPAGAYTAIVSGKNGGTGVGLVEVYNLQ